MEKSIREILDTYGKYTSLTSGTSMRPLLKEHRDTIIVVKPEGRLKKYDIALYCAKNGKYILHRVVEVHDDHYIIIGDNRNEREYVTDDMICGVLIGFYRKGKRYVDCQNGKLYKLYSHIWVALLPIRPLLVWGRRVGGAAKRRLLKLFGNGR